MAARARGGEVAGAAAILVRDGCDVSNPPGGMRAWAQAGLPVVARDGGANRVS